VKAALHPGRLLARRYRLIDQIGAGGMSVIWRARDEVLDRVVALKVLAASLAADARFRAPAQPATDVYSLGVLLYEALTGRVPYPADTWEQLSSALAGGPAPSLADVPELPPALARICLRCLARDPAARPTARQVSTALRDQLLPADPQAATMLAPTVTLPAVTSPSPVGAPPPPAAADGADAGAAADRRPHRRPVLLLVPVVLAVGVALAVPAVRPDEHLAPRTQPTAGPLAPAPTEPPPPSPSTPAPSSAPPTDGAPTARPGTVVEAANRVDGLIGAGLTAGEIRADVGLDLRNQLRNLTAAVSGQDDLAPPVARLREKVAIRLREGAISREYAGRLDTAIAELGAAQV
jgi:hypothetical protein